MAARVRSFNRAVGILTAVAALAAVHLDAQNPPWLRVSDNKRVLVTADGQPFFWLGDTAWELFHRLNREEALRYLRNRAERRFTVVQAVALAELDGTTPRRTTRHRDNADDYDY